MQQTRLLFVDDEPSIRLTLPTILRQHGFDVRVAATVAEALTEINTQSFDVLISDLNIGHPADGFVVVSAMRHLQPKCLNFILTGYPAFETALQAVKTQVDDYLVKPAEVVTLLARIKAKLSERKPTDRQLRLRVATLLRENIEGIQRQILKKMKSDPELSALWLSDEQRVCCLPSVLKELAELLETVNPTKMTGPTIGSSAQNGEHRQRQGYSVPMLVSEARIRERAIFDFVQDHILELDLSYLVSDLKRVVEVSQRQLHESTKAFLEAESKAAERQERDCRHNVHLF